MNNAKLIKALKRVISELEGVDEDEIAEAGMKDILKRIGKSLLGVILFSQTAFGINLKAPKEMCNIMKTAVKELSQEYRSDSSYTVKMTETKSGSFQKVVFTITKDGKDAANVTFVGDKDNIKNDLDSGIISEDSENDPVVYKAKEILETAITNMIEKEVLRSE